MNRPKYPFYSLQPGETCTIQANPIKVHDVTKYLRKSRGWLETDKVREQCDDWELMPLVLGMLADERCE